MQQATKGVPTDGSLLTAGLLFGSSALLGCGGSGVSNEESPDSAPRPDAGPSASKVCPQAWEPSPKGHTAIGLARDSVVGYTDVRVVFCNPLMPAQPEQFLFFVILAEHLGGVPQSDLTKPTWIETNTGLRVEDGFSWKGSDLTIEDHHATGYLTGPRTTREGIELIGADTTYLELHLDGIGCDRVDAVFRWEQAYLP